MSKVTMTLSFDQQKGQFEMQGPMNNEPLCHMLLGMANMRLTMLAMERQGQGESGAERRPNSNIVAPGPDGIRLAARRPRG